MTPEPLCEQLSFAEFALESESFKDDTGERRVCSKCDAALPLSCFSAHSGSKVLLRSECKKCNKKLGKERKTLRDHYGLPPDDYCCPICKKNAEQVAKYGGKAGPWVVDHVHNYEGDILKAFRGWLCHKCNRAIGGFEDDPERLTNALSYLDKNFESIHGDNIKKD